MPPRRRGPRDAPDSMKTSPQTSRPRRARRGGRPRRPQRSRQERAGDTERRRRAAHGWNRYVLAPTNSRRLAAKSRAPNGAFFNSLLGRPALLAQEALELGRERLSRGEI